MVPPIKLWDRGVPNEAALRIMTRNSRMPDSLAADLDAECSACLMGARRLGELFDRYGRDDGRGLLRRDPRQRPPRSTGARSSPRSPTAPTSGRTTPSTTASTSRGCTRQRITLTKNSTGDRDGGPLVIDFTGTGPQAKGPINHCGDYADGNFLKKWLAPILRNLADTPERMAELDVNEGVVPLIEMRFPEKGTLLTPIFPAPTNARTFVILRLLGVLAGVLAKAIDGRMPADQETIRYTGVYGTDRDGKAYLMREVLGGGSGGRYYADGEDTIHVVPDSRNLPTEFTECRFPFASSGSGWPSTPAAPGGTAAAGLREAHPDAARRALHVDRRPLDPGLLGRQGRQGRAAVPGHRRPGRPGRARGRRARRRRAAAGRAGGPHPDDGRRRLGRPAGAARRGGRARHAWRKVSVAGARRDYGVVPSGDRDEPVVDEAATEALRPELRAARTGEEPFFDRGPGYATLSGGASAAEVDWV